jgi:hypothetical protein
MPLVLKQNHLRALLLRQQSRVATDGNTFVKGSLGVNGETVVGGPFMANEIASFDKSVTIEGTTQINKNLNIDYKTTGWGHVVVNSRLNPAPGTGMDAVGGSILFCGTTGNYPTETRVFQVFGNGNVTATGTICAPRIKSFVGGGCTPDYVFEPEYRLPTLQSTENYIKVHRHLPEVPSAAELERDGMDLAQMNLILLKKVEEMTLHMIRLEKEIQCLKDGKSTPTPAQR